MSKSMSSPTARILRSSRMFSLPPPLPTPVAESILSNGFARSSDTATLPYPSRQAISSPASSREHGDWGLKRPLPRKTTRTSDPYVRINAIDTFEHVTDFESATDHTQSLKKFQAMHIPMRLRPSRTASGNTSNYGLVSAFDERYDNTCLSMQGAGNGETADRELNELGVGSERALRLRDVASQQKPRWRTRGPNLGLISQLEFDDYVKKVVESPRVRADFRQFLREVQVQKNERAFADNMREKGQGYDPQDKATKFQIRAIREGANADAEVDRFLLQLRDSNDNLSSELSRLIREFFDLPPFPTASSGMSLSSAENLTNVLRQSTSAMAENPPTHPSAGLSYSRLTPWTTNHPTNGPQSEKSPIKVRTLKPRKSIQGTEMHPLFGVGGFAAPLQHSASYGGSNKHKTDAGNNWNFEDDESTKTYMTPQNAYIDGDGKVHISLTSPDKEAVAVKDGAVDPRIAQSENDYAMRQARMQATSAPLHDPEASRGSGRRANFGTALPDLARTRRAEGLNTDELEHFKKTIKRRPANINQGIRDAISNNEKNASMSMVDMLNRVNERSRR